MPLLNGSIPPASFRVTIFSIPSAFITASFQRQKHEEYRSAKATAAMTKEKEKYWSHSQSGDVNKPVGQVENRKLIVHADNARSHTHSGSITRIHGGERTRKSHSPTVLTGFGTL
jgi:hypothetical protein